MRLQNAVEMPLMQLVNDPMLVASGRHNLSYDQHSGLLAPITVVTPWTFGGEESRGHVWSQMKEEWDARRA
jgi:hypothetical protein